MDKTKDVAVDNTAETSINDVAITSNSVSANSINTLNLFNAKDLASAELFMSKIMKSSKGGITSVQEGLAIRMRAQDLQLPFSTCIEHIHVINGKTGIDVHVIKALLLRAGVTWKCVQDYAPLYEYTDGINVYIDGSFPDYVTRCKSKSEADKKTEADKDGDNMYVYPVRWYADFNGNFYRDYQLNGAYHKVVTTKAQAIELAKENKIGVYRVVPQASDYCTSYEFERTVNGKLMTSIGKFSYQDAVQADMFTKDTYKKYPKVLIGHRAFTYGARDIASDILFGVMETTELKVVSNAELVDADIIDIDVDVID